MNKFSDPDELHFRADSADSPRHDLRGGLTPAIYDPREGPLLSGITHQDRRRHLVIAAVDVWSRHGYAALDISSAARHAGVSRGVMKSYFADRDQLIVGCVAFVRDEIQLDPAGLMATARDVNELVEAFVGCATVSLSEHSSLQRVRYDLLNQSMFNDALVASAESLQQAWMVGIDGFVFRFRSLATSMAEDAVRPLVIEDLFALSMRRHTESGVERARSFTADLRAYIGQNANHHDEQRMTVDD